MKENKIIDVVVFYEDGRREKATIEECLETYYDIMDCDTIDIVERTVNGHSYNIICDDNGLISGRTPVGAWTNDDGDVIEALSGTVIMAGDVDDEGYLCSIPENETDELLKIPSYSAYFGNNPIKLFLYEG